MYQVLKRDGKVVKFDIQRISKAITSAFEAQEKPFVPDVIDFLALKVTADFADKIKDKTDVVSPQENENNVRFIIMDYFREKEEAGIAVDAPIEGRVTVQQ